MEHYKHSGAVPILGALMTIVAGLLAASLLGVVYTYVLYYIPIVYFNVLLPVGLAFAIGFVVSMAGTWGKIRNTPVLAIIGFFCGLVSLYVAWAADAYVRTSFGFSWAFAPDVLIAYIQLFYERGDWTLFGDEPIAGISLAAIWVIEAAIIVGGAAFTALVANSEDPFCERCDVWADVEKGVRRLKLERGSQASAARLLQGDLTALAESERAEKREYPHLRLDLATCGSCQDSNYLTIQSVTESVNDKGETSTSEEALLTNLVITPEQVQLVRDAGTPAAPQAEEGNFDFLKTDD